ncbi:FAD-dependent oxidoreductase [Endozoicomonas ascidiicola]|uniref:FAD-dependent oxidoreductase n=1 Tax=Endozoicomonas ascidiicola TaxID=1698521 RepID=UPI00083102F5|nr:FAD-dependent oxidoreductase [Endozoicomonas ascidiicola]
MQTFDVIIVGGGMVGASLALALDNSGLQIALIDQQSLQPERLSHESPWEPRVSALTETSIQFFRQLHAWEAMVAQRVCPYNYMDVWDGEGTGSIQFDASSLTQDSLGYIVENKVIRNGLLQQLSDSGIHCFEQQPRLEYQLSGQGGSVTLVDGQTLQAPLLVAADGAESHLRRLSGIPSNQKDYKHHAIVTTVETELDHGSTARQVFLDTGPLAFLPLPDREGKHYCSIVWSLIPSEADRIEQLNDEDFCQELQRAIESRLGAVLCADQRLRFPLRQRHARQYHRQGVVLVGDAAHTIHPLAGQGVNLGLMDAMVLAEEITRAVHREDDWFAAHILDRYQRRRKAPNTSMMAAMSGFQNLFGSDDIGVRWLRNTGLKVTNRLPVLKSLLIQQANGLGR